jgi:hypothetical protein
MQEDYIQAKFHSEIFCERINRKLDELKDKKVLIYGVGKAFSRLNGKFSLSEKLNIVGYVDKKFEETTTFNEKPAINPDNIKTLDFDVTVITLEYPQPVEELFCCLGLEKDIFAIFKEEDPLASAHFRYLKKIKFDKHLKKIKRILKNKKIVIYGTGCLFQLIYENYDLSGLNIIGISDKKYEANKEDKFFKDKFKIYAPSEISALNPDYVLVGTLYFVKLIDILEKNVLNNKKIKVKPLINKPFWEIFNEVWY